MQIFILNFSKTRVDNVAQALELSSLNEEDVFKEYKIQNFFEDSLYKILKEVEFINSNSIGGGGAIIMSFNYPLLEKRDKDFAREFYQIAKESNTNLYYYPKPNHYMEVDDFALFSLKSNLTPENLKIESLYRKDLIPRDLRGKLHTLLRKDKGIEEKYIQKKFFYESRKLFNLSWQWNEFQVSQEQLEYDLIDRVQEWYAGPIMVNLATTNICNLSCIMCSLHSEEAKSKEQATDYFAKKKLLETDKVYEVLDFVGKYSINAGVGFIASGEPLLDNRLIDFIAYAKSKKIPIISVCTNGTLIEQKGEELFKAGLNRMTISIDGATQETYRKIRGTDLEKVERGVRKCVEYARQINSDGGKIEFELACVLVFDDMSETQHKELYLSKWKDCRDVIKRITFNELAVFDEEGYETRNNATIDVASRMNCMYPYQRMMIDPYGAVSVCCTMSSSAYHKPYSVGNVYQNDLEEIWVSKEMSILRKENILVKFNNFDICKKCSEWAFNAFDIESQVNAKEKTISFT